MSSKAEQAEIKTIGPLSSTLELFDSFKSQEEDKDSDEESFHLPLLSCDDDNEVENCEGDILTSIPNGETEDDILNKYETSTSETADAKEKHLLLHEGDGTDLNNTGQKLDNIVKFMELDVQDVPEIDLQDTVKIAIEDIVSVGTEETKNKADVNVNDSGALNIQVDNVYNRKDTIDCQKESEDESKKQLENTRKNVEQEEQQQKESEEKTANTEKKESDSKELETNKDEDCEDLLDISVILDADEDNASALSNEKSDDNDDTNDTNSSDQNTCTDDTSDSETIQSESDSQNPPSVDDISEINSNRSFRDIDNKSEEKSSGRKGEKEEISGDTKRDEEMTSPVSTGKRPLIESDNHQSPVVNKKIRMFEEFSEENQTAKLDKRQASSEKKSEEGDITSLGENSKTNSTKNDELKTLITFEKFMKQRNLGEGKLTRLDLEQFCLQKICEALVHKTDTGELHQTIKKQQQMIESLRKDVEQLSKQTRDLDIVNKKLMTELQSHNNNQKPIVPLKITRSVGLQVKLNTYTKLTFRRKSLPNTATPPRTPSTPVPPIAVNRQRNVQVNDNVIRQVPTTPSTAPSPRKTPTTAPILTQALQIRPTPTAEASTSGVPQGVRLTSAQIENGIAIPASVVTSTAGGTTQLMYMVQPGSAGNSGTDVQKAVLLNFQPTTNGVLTSQEMTL
ncbi:myb-like protein X isoform X2 [Diorhabda carinulata]|uniref:myb-like protein X isoform X2 n=1 Tax=Diorhabda carinulata TaxID=1163345 RepID=UPI0025A24871|nr:myb-like protein X isoform X2 [Diorhabda carinulata]